MGHKRLVSLAAAILLLAAMATAAGCREKKATCEDSCNMHQNGVSCHCHGHCDNENCDCHDDH